jgi:hypothetical protein
MVCGLMPPSTSLRASFSAPMLPEQKTMLLALMTWEKAGSRPGALEVQTSEIDAIS